MVKSEQYNIPKRHRWIRALNMGTGFNPDTGKFHKARISGFYNIVKVFKPGDKILNLVNCTSTYHRFTEYWFFRSNGGNGILHQSDEIPAGIKNNIILSPIFKPWAAVELIAFSPTPLSGGNGNFGVAGPDNNNEYSQIHQKLID